MKKIIGNSFYDIDKLLMNDSNIVIIQGDVRTDILRYGESCGKRFSTHLNMSGETVVSLRLFSFRGLVMSSLKELDKDDIEYTVEIPKLGGSKSTIYGVAKQLKIKVSIEEFNDTYEVGLRTKTRRKNVSVGLKQWIFSLPYDAPTLIPDDIKEGMSDVYIRTVISKSLFVLSYSKSKVTKHKYKLCNRNNSVQVRTTCKVLANIPNVTIKQLTDEHRSHLNLQLMPYGIKVVGKEII